MSTINPTILRSLERGSAPEGVPVMMSDEERQRIETALRTFEPALPFTTL
jgi:hypothetical protein